MRAFMYSVAIVIVILSSMCQAAKYTYWVHESCNDRDDFDLAIPESLDAAENAGKRLQQDEEKQPNMYAIFKRMFRTDLTTDRQDMKRVRGNTQHFST